jgi:hypothetical protein
MISQHQERKYGIPKYKGPYTMDTVNDNGTIRLSVPKGNRTVYEMWNIRNIHPCTGIDPPVGFCAVQDTPVHPILEKLLCSPRSTQTHSTLVRGRMQYTAHSHSRLRVPDGTEP